MAIEEDKCIEVVIKNDDPTIKPIALENIGFLKKEATFVQCPACDIFALTMVHLEAVTCLQRLLQLTKWCKNWESRSDINHYCSKCGCFIGRYVPISCIERCISRNARKKAAVDSMSLRSKPNDCATNMQKRRERVKSEQAKEKAKKEARLKEAEEKSKTEGATNGQ